MSIYDHLKTRAAGYPPDQVTESKFTQHVQLLRTAAAQSNHEDGAFQTYEASRVECRRLINQLLLPLSKRQSDGRGKERIFAAVRDYIDCIAVIAAQLKTSLAQEPAWPDPREGVGASRVRGDRLAANHATAQQDAAFTESLLKAATAGRPFARQMKEILIAPKGDAILEFANDEALLDKPMLRFRVQSHALSATSPLFRRIFQGNTDAEMSNADDDSDEEILSPILLPRHPSRTMISGTSVTVYRMPHIEHDDHGSLSLLLHAAHMHTELLPQKLSFDALVALARTALRYSCTRPVEVPLEYIWWPQHIHRAQTDEMPDGLVLVSYAFGMRGLFTRMTKTVVLNARNERADIMDKEDWPLQLRERLSQICRAKRAQLWGIVKDAVGEFLRPPPPVLALEPWEEGREDDDGRRRGSASSEGSFSGAESETLRSVSIASPTVVAESTTSSAPPSFHPLPGSFTIRAPSRCPKGSHWCDATNLGWLMLVLNELNLLGGITSSSFSPDISSKPRSRSIAELVSALRTVPSPPYPVHAAQRPGGVCDPAPPLRQAISDVFNSVAGLTLHEINGRKGMHGWGLSREHRKMRQAVYEVWRPAGGGWTDDGDGNMKVADVGRSLLSEQLCFQLLKSVEREGDIKALARVNKSFWSTFCKHKEALLDGSTLAGGEKVLILGQARDSPDDESVAEDDTDSDGASTYESTAGAPEMDSMSPEEAEAILWPKKKEPPPLVAHVSAAIPSTEGCREKFLAKDVLFIDQKTLAVMDEKELREERDKRLGLISPGTRS